MKPAFLLFAALSLPLHASMISLDVSGMLGPVLSGVDPLSLSGQDFVAEGIFQQDFVLIGTTADSATYSLPGNLQIVVGALVLTGYNGTLTLTAPPSGPDSMSLDFSIIEFIFQPQASATVSLPPGTLNGVDIQDFAANVGEPDSSLSYQAIGYSTVVSGDLGITGTASLSGAGGPQAPEPGTIGLLAAGLFAVAFAAFRSRVNKLSSAKPCAIVVEDGNDGESCCIRHHAAGW